MPNEVITSLNRYKVRDVLVDETAKVLDKEIKDDKTSRSSLAKAIQQDKNLKAMHRMLYGTTSPKKVRPQILGRLLNDIQKHREMESVRVPLAEDD